MTKCFFLYLYCHIIIILLISKLILVECEIQIWEEYCSYIVYVYVNEGYFFTVKSRANTQTQHVYTTYTVWIFIDRQKPLTLDLLKVLHYFSGLTPFMTHHFSGFGFVAHVELVGSQISSVVFLHDCVCSSSISCPGFSQWVPWLSNQRWYLSNPYCWWSWT